MAPSNKPKKQAKVKTTAFPLANTSPLDSGNPTASPSDDISSPASATHVAFRHFIEIAELGNIKLFLETAASTSDGENLRLLWARAFKEGLMAGHQLYGKTVEKLNEAHNRGRVMAKGVEMRRLIGDVKDIVVSAHIYRFIRIQAPKPSHQPSSTQAPLPPTSTPPLASRRRPRLIHHLLYPLSQSTVARRRKTTTTTARLYRLYLQYQPSNAIHHLKRNRVPLPYLHRHVSIGRMTPPPHSPFSLVTRHRATFHVFAHRPQDRFHRFNVVTKNSKNNFSDCSIILTCLQFTARIIFILVPFPRTLPQLHSYQNQVGLRRQR